MTWTNRTRVAFPLSLLDKANHLAHIIDPDVGGDQTFSADRLKGGMLYAEIPFVEDFLPLVQRKNPSEWFAATSQLAEMRGRKPLSQDAVNALCAALLIGEECNQLDDIE